MGGPPRWLVLDLGEHAIFIGTGTSVTWADDVDALFSRWRRLRFRKPNAQAITDHLERVARDAELTFPVRITPFVPSAKVRGHSPERRSSSPHLQSV